MASSDWKFELVYELLRQTHRAHNRSKKLFKRAIEHSLCFGAYVGKREVGFAGVVSDHATFSYLMDVVVDPAWRGRGIGRALVRGLVDDPIVSSIRTFLLRTESVHGIAPRDRRHTQMPQMAR